jgi:hypothetical protein
VALTSTAAYKTDRGIAGTDYDTVIGNALGKAEARVKRYLGRDLEEDTYTHTFDGPGSDRLLLKEWPVTSITSVSLVDSAGSLTVLESSAYVLDAGVGILTRTGYGSSAWIENIEHPYTNRPTWPGEAQSIRVVYVAGYSTTPDDLVEAVYRIADTLISQRRVSLGDSAIPAGAVSRALRSPAEERAALDEMLSPFMRGVFS